MALWKEVSAILRQPDFQGPGQFAEIPDVLYGYQPENTRWVKREPEGDEPEGGEHELL